MKKVAAILATLVLVATSTLAAPADTAASAVPSPANNKAGVTKPASVKAATDKGGADKAAAGAGDWYYPPYGAAPGTQPGCGPYGCRNPTGTWGLERDPRQYRALCAQHSLSAEDDYRSRACFDTDRKLEEVLSAPNPHRLYGYIDGSDTNFVLFSGQSVTFDDRYELHVDEANYQQGGGYGCSRVRIYQLPSWYLKSDQIWCPSRDQTIII